MLGLRLLKYLGFTLIALPEPFTTPIGVGLIVAARFLAKKRETRVFRHFEKALTGYLNHIRRTEYEMFVGRDLADAVEHHALDMELLSKVYKTPSVPIFRSPQEIVHHSLNVPQLLQHYGNDIAPKPLVRYSLSKYIPEHTEARPPEKVVRHTLDMDRLSQRYGIGSQFKPVEAAKAVHRNLWVPAASGYAYEGTEGSHNLSVPTSFGHVESPAPGKVEYHVVDMARLSRIYERDNVSSGGVSGFRQSTSPGKNEISKHHTVDVARLLRRYGMEDRSPTLTR